MTVNVASLMSGLSEQGRFTPRPTSSSRSRGRSSANKYLTSAWDGLDKGEPFHLLNHRAQDIRGYDCVKYLVLSGRYSCEWRPYSNLGGQRGEFRYLALEVTSDAIATNIESS
jgi:hypothetical protein